MISYRVAVLLCLVCFTACGVCSSLLPLFRASGPNPDTNTTTQRYTIHYWYTETAVSGNDSRVMLTRLYNSDRACSKDRLYFTASAALSTAAAGLGGAASLMAATWLYAGYGVRLHIFLSLATLLSCACYAATMAMVVEPYVHSPCTDEPENTSAIKDLTPSYSMVEGFALLCCATGGMCISFFMVIFHFCFCNGYCCRHRNSDDEYARSEEDEEEARSEEDAKDARYDTSTTDHDVASTTSRDVSSLRPSRTASRQSLPTSHHLRTASRQSLPASCNSRSTSRLQE